MIFHGLIETRTIKTPSGSGYRQRRFYCHFHGWYDLFVFPDAERDHEKCRCLAELRDSSATNSAQAA